jgi:hypothetical protein
MRDNMKHRGGLFATLIIIGILSSMVLPSVNAEVFDIGTKISQSDTDHNDRFRLAYFDSGSVVYAEKEYVDYTEPIFDGDESTGIDHNFGSGFNTIGFELVFPYPIYVTNITVKPSFHGKASNSSLFVTFDTLLELQFSDRNPTQQTFQVNCKIVGVVLYISKVGANDFYFNDVLINYSPEPTNPDNIVAAIDHLNNSFMTLQNQINSLNLTTNENITQIENQFALIESNINDLHQSLVDLTTNVTELSEIQNLIDQTTQDILYLNENITEIKNTIPLEYDDTALTTRVFQLESENAALSNDIQNLTKEIENLKDEPDDFVPLGAFILGILGILIALMAVILATRKREPERLDEEKEGSEEDENSASEEDP